MRKEPSSSFAPAAVSHDARAHAQRAPTARSPARSNERKVSCALAVPTAARDRDTHLVIAQGALHTRSACGGVLLEDSPKTAPIATSVLRIGAASAHGAIVVARTRVAAMSS